MKSTHARWLLSGILMAGCAILPAQAATIRVVGGAWRTFSHVGATGLLVEAAAELGGTGTVQAATTVRGTLRPGDGTNAGTLIFGDAVAFDDGTLESYAATSSELGGLSTTGRVSGVATVRMTRAATAFPTQQVVVAGAADSDYAQFVLEPSTNWAKGTTGALNLWVTYGESSRVVLYDLFLRMEGGVVQVCWQTASEEACMEGH